MYVWQLQSRPMLPRQFSRPQAPGARCFFCAKSIAARGKDAARRMLDWQGSRWENERRGSAPDGCEAHDFGGDRRGRFRRRVAELLAGMRHVKPAVLAVRL